MTEQELIDQMTALNVNARTVLENVQLFATQASGTVTFALYGGSAVTVNTLQQMQTDLDEVAATTLWNNYTRLGGF